MRIILLVAKTYIVLIMETLHASRYKSHEVPLLPLPFCRLKKFRLKEVELLTQGNPVRQSDLNLAVELTVCVLNYYNVKSNEPEKCLRHKQMPGTHGGSMCLITCSVPPALQVCSPHC